MKSPMHLETDVLVVLNIRSAGDVPKIVTDERTLSVRSIPTLGYSQAVKSGVEGMSDMNLAQAQALLFKTC